RRWTGLLLLDDHIHEHFVKHSRRSETPEHQAADRAAAEARVATAATADTDAVVLINPVIAAQQAAAATAVTVAPEPVPDAVPGDAAGLGTPAKQ
ncbi:MAG: hypothetical protein HOV83_00130, partial [Catenulispora sp.]|nr:hypothetical protein [Catenulispora sp.]